MVHQNMDAIIEALRNHVSPWGAFSLGHIAATAEEDHVILDNEIIVQIACSHDLNDAMGYYAVWFGKRTEANGGVIKRDFEPVNDLGNTPAAQEQMDALAKDHDETGAGGDN